MLKKFLDQSKADQALGMSEPARGRMEYKLLVFAASEVARTDFDTGYFFYLHLVFIDRLGRDIRGG